MTIASWGAAVGWPTEGVDVDKGDWRGFNGLLLGALGSGPTAFATYVGQPAVVRGDGKGYSPAGASGAPYVDFAGIGVRGFKPYPVALFGNTVATQNLHDGCLLYYTGGSAISLTFARTSDPALGLQDNFTCRVFRSKTAGAIQFVFSGLTNGNPDGHTRVDAGRPVEVWLLGSGTELEFWGGTIT